VSVGSRFPPFHLANSVCIGIDPAQSITDRAAILLFCS
jgi:hypothetical protein